MSNLGVPAGQGENDHWFTYTYYLAEPKMSNHQKGPRVLKIEHQL